MLATQMPDSPPEVEDVKQIKEKLAQSLKALQKKYVTSDEVVTSEDGDANLLCCALEAIFIHGIKSKFIRSEAGTWGRKGDRGPLPQPFFWSLLKSVTHSVSAFCYTCSDVITELEKINFVSTDVGRCRAWLRLALNHGLVECYLASLFREDSMLRAYYQPSAFLLNSEEREVLLSYLQGLASLTFNLSYKSAVLNEWTTTPLALAGLCPMSKLDTFGLLLNGDYQTKSVRKESWDTVSQSSGSSDCQALPAKGSGVLPALNSSNLSLDTTGSSQLSSSLSSDSLLQGQVSRSLTAEQWSSGDLDPPIHVSTKKSSKDFPSGNRESRNCSQDSMREDSFVSSAGVDPFSENATFSGSDSEIQGPAESDHHPTDQPPSYTSEPEPASLDLPSCEEQPDEHQICNGADSVAHLCPPVVSTLHEPELFEKDVKSEGENSEPVQDVTQSNISEESSTKTEEHQSSLRSSSITSRKLSSESLPHSDSWISADDIFKPHLEKIVDDDEAPPAAELKTSQSPPSVVHRRQIGLSNPFRGLLKLGHLDRKGAMGMWRDYYCELSPFEFRLYVNAEERTCCENCSLLRCEDARITSSEGRFELAFPGKRLYLRAANHDEAEDWVDRIVEAVNKCRPAAPVDEQWEVLRPISENGLDECSVMSPSSAPGSPERLSAFDRNGLKAGVSPQEFNWTQTVELELDALKEAVLYFSTEAEPRVWTPMVFSLSLEALKGFLVHEGKKSPRLSYPIEEIRDVVPDVSLGGPAFFKLLTVKHTIKFRAENPNEARSWRVLIRGALDAYLESGEDGPSEDSSSPWNSGSAGNLHRLIQHQLKEDGALLTHLYTVQSEKGLDSQSFKCADCSQQIGPSLGRARLCEFSGQYYCDSCHIRDTSIIPSRMLHNWDLIPREVSKRAVRVLAHIQQEPLLNLELLNPELVKHSESMAQVHSLRNRLRLLGDYLLTCRSGAYKHLQKKMEKRTYLLESSHLYSIMDLQQIAEGQYSNFLITLVQHACKHVLNCDLCSQRGFICQICHSDDILFPFQFESTVRCKDCKAVFHAACKSASRSCPRCQRMKKYLERDLED
ncbi:pleckstrin homology domain-containing family M member 1 isoform X1 [Oryzias melastigma]|uniref:pleckstrin homology domain-containing family M member 1 isoform X1 n=1 Tax=Oryzias melastigma TaxID=30732 RepID=UPI00168D4049|nr:pleckstrin homology domain-containing family M member 1 isoform X1 [Oryzias melastigma]